MAKLFKNKIIKQKLETFQIENFEQKLEVVKAWHKDYYTGTLKQDKEISRAPGWTQDFLGEVLGYIRKPNENHSYDTEYSVAGQRPDFVLAHFSHTQKGYVIGELKDAKTSLDAPQKREGSVTPIQQAFKYKGNLRDSSFVIVSNFFETRLYYDNYLDYELWTLDTLIDPKNNYFELRKFIFLLSEGNLIAKRGESHTKGLISFIQSDQKEITKKFYKEYSLLRKELFKDIIVQAKKSGKTYKQTELDMILSKTQKIIDRIIFIHFCEDLDLFPQGKLKENLLRAEEIGFSPWEMLKKFFEFVNSGSERLGIPDGYNGGLFHKDEELEALEIGDEICKKFVDLGDYDFEDDLSVNILGHIFEQSISDIEELKDKIQKNEEVTLSKRKKDGVFYTPEYIVDYIVKNSVGKKIEDWEQELREKHKLKEDITDKNYTKRAILVYTELQEKLQNITVLDPACGSGAFLVNVFDFLLSKNKEISKTLEDLGVNQGLFSTESHFRTILQKNIYGVDLNEESVEITKLSLWLKTAIKGRKLANLDQNIKCGNSLIDDKEIAGDKAFSWETEFPQIFSDGGFDVIVGNPPYVRQELFKEHTHYLSKTYNSYSGKSDLYVYFFEKASELINSKGIFGFISSGKFLEANYGINLRKYLHQETTFDKVINFGDLEVFEGISAYPLIFIAKKHFSGVDYRYLEVKNLDFTSIEDLMQENSIICSTNDFEKDGYNIFSKFNSSFLEKINKNSIKIGAKYTLPTVGIKTGYNDGYLHKYGIPYIFGRNIKKYFLKGNEHIVFPYQWNNNEYQLVNENIDTITPLLEHKEKLSKRAIIREGIKSGNKKWYEYQQINRKLNLDKEYIVYPNVSLGSNFTLSSGKAIDMTGFILPFNSKYILSVLNSKVFEYFINLVAIKRRGGYVENKTQYISEFPIKDIIDEKEAPFIEKADFMLENNKIMGEKVQKFLKRVQGTFELEKLSKKLQAFYELSFEEFVKELKKVKVVLSLKDQDEWEEYFDSYKTEIVELKTKIDACDKEIDEMVFDLYGLSEEEREVVINS